MKIKIVGSDIDGVWTDGGMYYDNGNNELKKFHTYDAAGINVLKKLKIDHFIATSEQTRIVERRMKKIGVNKYYQGVENKYLLVSKILETSNNKWDNLAYVGDDINDYEVLKRAGVSACPINAPEYIKKIVDFIIPISGGNGVFRYFVEIILLPYLTQKSIEEIYGIN